MKTVKQLESVLVKPAGPDCNLACNYCFYLEKLKLFSDSKIHRMSGAILEETIRQVMNQAGENVSFGWQGGEPTLMGLSFFEKVIEYQKRYGRGQIVGNGLQTNGILIDEPWANFLNKHHFLVGLSLDGPEYIHNRYRRTRGGQGTWMRVVDSAKLMLDKDVAVNALTVVNDFSVQFPQAIYEFHKELGLNYMQFIPCLETDPYDPGRAASFSVSPEKYGDFLCRLFDLWMADFIDNQPTTSIRFFDSVFYNYVDLLAPECTLLPACGVYLVVEHNGDVFSCDFFVEPAWKLGNVMEGDLSQMLNSERQYEFGRMKAEIPEDCKNCKWLRY
ncbi:MAG: anaerobic sulfatase maturase, partial [bacterium]